MRDMALLLLPNPLATTPLQFGEVVFKHMPLKLSTMPG